MKSADKWKKGDTVWAWWGLRRGGGVWITGVIDNEGLTMSDETWHIKFRGRTTGEIMTDLWLASDVRPRNPIFGGLDKPKGGRVS